MRKEFKMEPKYDFSGWATRNDILCADGRTIRRDAFKSQDGDKVPLVYSHVHDDIHDVLGHAILENREDGVYAYGYFNNTDAGKIAKEAVAHGDLDSLSIYANHLKQNGRDVIHGIIREVSLVMAGANPGAYIDVPIVHSEEPNYDDFEGVIYTPDEYTISLAHSENEEPEKKENDKEESKENKDMAKERTVKDVYDEMTEEQQKVVKFMIAAALENESDNNDDEEDKGEDMKHNLFDNEEQRTVPTKADYEGIFKNAKRLGSLKQAVEEDIQNDGVLAHSVFNSDGNEATYGVANVDMLFPDYKNLNATPEWIKRDTDWVNVVMNGVQHTPFSRIKSMFANITMDEARARGYLKGKKKKEEVISLLKRTTDPQTVYKKQKLDRDDTIDIVDFDVVAWLKKEMRLMLDEELARAFLIGDGRLATDEDHIDHAHIRPIWGDDELYSIQVHVPTGSDNAITAKNIITTFLRNRKHYKGSGQMIYFTTEDWLCEMLLLEDGFGHPLYADEAALARKLRVTKIVTVPVMENQTAGSGDSKETLVGIAVDLKDYNVGADKGGSIELFDDFDIDFNQMKYLIETRCSGALIKPFSAMVVTIGGTKTTYSEVTATGNENPKTQGWYEKEGDLFIASKDTTVNTKKTYYAKESVSVDPDDEP